MKNFEGLDKMKLEVLDAIQALQPQSKLKTVNIQEYLLSISQEQPASPDDVASLSLKMETLSALLSDFAQAGKTIRLDQVLLQTLHFPAMKVRYEDISTAHAKTFSWVLNPKHSEDAEYQAKFVQWLQSGSGTYLIMGKAGSGKSTLMKYIWRQPETSQNLMVWSAGRPLVKAYHFFWNSGTKLQKSQEGLLRSLLFEVLRQCPHLIPDLCTEAVQRLSRSEEVFWTHSELAEALGKLLDYPHLPAKFCFFIDGLDEYDATGGDHTELVKLLQKISNCSAIKLCVSSRPWFVFRDAFGQERDRFLNLEDLTHDDIQLFVHSKLREHPRFRQLHLEDHRYVELEMQIVHRAQGVFLWVFLVCRSLVQGLTNADRVSDLQRRLDLLPDTLEKFFQHMLESVESVYKSQTSEAFQIALHAPGPLYLLTYSFLDEEDPDFAMNIEIEPLGRKEIDRRHDDMRRRLDGRCKGLLEVNRANQQPWPNINGFFTFKVEFLHRTVRDFLLTKDMQKMLQENLPEGFSAQKQLIKAFIAQLKTLPQTELDRDSKGPFGDFLEDIVFFAQELEDQSSHPDPELLCLLEEVGSVVFKRPRQWRRGKKTAFPGLAIERGLFYFTHWTLEKNRQILQSRGRPLLDFALFPSRPKYEFAPRLRPKIVELLLESGADPNQSYKDSTVWIRFISKIGTIRREIHEYLTRICALLIEHGADLGKKIDVENDTQRNTGEGNRDTGNIRSRFEMQVCLEASQVIQEVFGEETGARLLAKAPKNSSLAGWFPWIFSKR